MKKKTRFGNKVVIITGASSGIGKATALEFAREGAQVVLVSRTKKKLDEVANQIRQLGDSDPLVIPTDISVEEEVKKMVGQVINTFQRIDLLFNNAGSSYVGRFDEQSFVGDLQKMLQVDLLGTIHTTRHVLEFMKKRRSGNIMNMSSVVGRKAFPHFGAYSSVMHAIAGFTDSLRQELRGTGINISIIHPALTQTALLDQVDPEKMPPPFRAMTPMAPEEVAKAVLDGFYHKKRRIIVPFLPNILLFLDAISPRLGDLMVSLLSRKFFAYLMGIYKGRTYHQFSISQ